MDAKIDLRPERIWYVADGDDSSVRATGAELLDWVRTGHVVPQTPLWTDGLDSWIDAGSVRGLFSRVAVPPRRLETGAAPPASAKAKEAAASIHQTLSAWQVLWGPVGFIVDFLKPLGPFSLVLAVAGWLLWICLKFIPYLSRTFSGARRHALAAGICSSVFAVGQLISDNAWKEGLAVTLFPSLQNVQDSTLALIATSVEQTAANTRETADNTKVIADNTAAAKKETSDDPKKELANQGFGWNTEGFGTAFANRDQQALGLFIKGGWKLQSDQFLGLVTSPDYDHDFVKPFVDAGAFRSKRFCEGYDSSAANLAEASFIVTNRYSRFVNVIAAMTRNQQAFGDYVQACGADNLLAIYMKLAEDVAGLPARQAAELASCPQRLSERLPLEKAFAAAERFSPFSSDNLVLDEEDEALAYIQNTVQTERGGDFNPDQALWKAAVAHACQNEAGKSTDEKTDEGNGIYVRDIATIISALGGTVPSALRQ